MSDDQERARVVADVPKPVKEAAKEKLEYGGLSREIEDLLERIAFGGEVNQRSRLQRQREALSEQLREKRNDRRELDAEIETLESRISGIDEKLSNLTTREDKFEAKVEELEAKLRHDGMHIDPDHPAVGRAAQTAGLDAEGVVQTLKERNPDVPAYAFEQPMHANGSWDGFSDSDVAARPVDERESDGVR